MPANRRQPKHALMVLFSVVVAILISAGIVHSSGLETPNPEEQPEQERMHIMHLVSQRRFKEAIKTVEGLSKKSPVLEVTQMLTSILEMDNQRARAQRVRLRNVDQKPGLPTTSPTSLRLEWCQTTLNEFGLRAGTSLLPVHDMAAAVRSKIPKEDLAEAYRVCRGVGSGSIPAYQSDPELKAIVGCLNIYRGKLATAQKQLVQALESNPNLPKFFEEMVERLLKYHWRIDFFEGGWERIPDSHRAAETLVKIVNSSLAFNLLSNSFNYGYPFHPNTTGFFRTQMHMSYLEHANFTLSGNFSRVLPAVVIWEESDEITIKEVHKAEPANRLTFVYPCIKNDSRKTSFQTRWGDFVPLEYQDKGGEIVYINNAVRIFSNLGVAQSSKYVYLAVPWGYAAGHLKQKPPQTPPMRIPQPTVVVLPVSTDNIYHHLVESVSIIAFAKAHILPLHKDLHVLLHDRPFYRELVELIELGLPVIWLQTRNKDKRSNVLLEQPIYVNFRLTNDTSAITGEEDSSEDLERGWMHRDYFNKYRPSAHSIRMARKMLRTALMEDASAISRDESCSDHPKVVFISRHSGPRSLPAQHENYLHRRLRKKYGDCYYRFRVVAERIPSLRKQWDVFSRADVIISAHGAGLAHLIWSSPNTTLVYFPIRPLVDVNHLHTAAAVGHHVVFLEDINCYIFSSFELPPGNFSQMEDILNAVSEALASKTGATSTAEVEIISDCQTCQQQSSDVVAEEAQVNQNHASHDEL